MGMCPSYKTLEVGPEHLLEQCPVLDEPFTDTPSLNVILAGMTANSKDYFCTIYMYSYIQLYL